MLALRLPISIEKRLNALAKATGRTKSYYAREAILEHLADLEDAYLAAHRIDDDRSGRSRHIPLATLVKKYGVQD